MRIISGKYGRRRIIAKAPAGVRPTTDNVKESLFNILNNIYDFEGLKVLDLFAGTGALGFEALSRGASGCIFVEKNRKVSQYLKSIAVELKIPEEDFQIYNLDFKSFFSNYNANAPEHKLDLIFADPPYALPVYNDILNLVFQKELLSSEGSLILESSEDLSFDIPSGLKIYDSRTMGTTKLTFIEINRD